MANKQNRGDEVTAQLNAHREAALRQYRQNSDVLRGVRILASDDSCDSCKALAAGGVHPLSDPPALPNADCNSAVGWCRCTYAPGTR
jgi:hypothetical protein